MLITKLKVLVPMGLVGTLVATGAWVMAQAQPADLIRIPPLPSALDSFRPSAKTPALGPGQAEAGAASKKGAVLPKARASIKKTRLDTSGWPKFANAAGWNWMINPSRFRFDGGGITQSSDHRYMVVDAVVDAASGGLRILIVKVDAGPPLSRPYDLQVVAFDAAGRRYLFKQANITHQGQDRNGNFSVWHTSFTLDPKMLSPEKVAFLGVETKAAMMR